MSIGDAPLEMIFLSSFAITQLQMRMLLTRLRVHTNLCVKCEMYIQTNREEQITIHQNILKYVF